MPNELEHNADSGEERKPPRFDFSEFSFPALVVGIIAVGSLILRMRYYTNILVIVTVIIIVSAILAFVIYDAYMEQKKANALADRAEMIFEETKRIKGKRDSSTVSNQEGKHSNGKQRKAPQIRPNEDNDR